MLFGKRLAKKLLFSFFVTVLVCLLVCFAFGVTNDDDDDDDDEDEDAINDDGQASKQINRRRANQRHGETRQTLKQSTRRRPRYHFRRLHFVL